MKIAICDDVKDCNDEMYDLLSVYMCEKKIRDYDIVPYCSGSNLINEYARGLFDFVFLDIEMPKPDGFETAEYIMKLDRIVGIIFVTYMEEQLSDSFRYRPRYYLHKPINQEKINKLMDCILDDFNYRDEDDLYDVKLKDGGTTQLYLPDILYFQSDNKYVVAATSTDSCTFANNLENVAADLKEEGFVRISRSVVVNKLHVFKIYGNLVVTKNGENFSIGTTYKKKIKNTLKGIWG